MYKSIGRVIAGLLFGTGQEVLFQVLSAVLWIRFWGAGVYAEWLMISLLPLLLLRGNTGLFHAATSDLIRQYRLKDWRAAGDTLASLYRSEYLFLGSVAIVYAVGIGTLSKLATLEHFSRGDLLAIAVLFLAQFLFFQRQQSVLCLAKANGNAPAAVQWQNHYRLVFIVTMLGLAAVFGPVVCLAAAVAAQGAIYVATLIRFRDLRRAAPRPSATIPVSTVLNLARNGLLFSLVPLGHTAVHTLSVWVVGFLFGPLAGASFHNMRTISRISVLLARAGENAVRLELSGLFASQDGVGSAKLVNRAVAVTALASVLVFALLLLFGERIFDLMTAGELKFFPAVFAILSAAALVHAVSQMYLGVAFSINRQSLLARRYFIVLGLLLLLIAPSAQAGLLVLAAVTLMAEIAMLIVARIAATSLLITAEAT